MSKDAKKQWDRLWRRRRSKRFNSSLLSRPAQMVLSTAGRRRGKVLDWGCGHGAYLGLLTEVASHVIGVDVSRNALMGARRNLAGKRLPVTLFQAGTRVLPFRNSSISGILSLSAIHHDSRRGMAKTIVEFVRVLRPGGWLVLAFPGTDAGRGVLEVPSEGPEKDIPHYYPSRSDVRRFMAGFDVIELIQHIHEAPDIKRRRVHWLVAARKPESHADEKP